MTTKIKWLLLITAVLGFVGWAISDSQALRTLGWSDHIDVGRVMALEIHAQNPAPGPGEYAHIVVRIRSAWSEAFQAPAPGRTGQDGYAWQVVGPDGAEVTVPAASALELEFLTARRRMDYRWRSPAGLDTIPAHFAETHFLDDPFRDAATQPPGEYRITLVRNYSTQSEWHEDLRPSGVRFSNRPAPAPRRISELPLASGTLRSNEIVITRTN